MVVRLDGDAGGAGGWWHDLPYRRERRHRRSTATHGGRRFRRCDWVKDLVVEVIFVVDFGRIRGERIYEGVASWQ